MAKLDISRKSWVDQVRDNPKIAADILQCYLAIERWANVLLPASFEIRESITGAVNATAFCRYYPQSPTRLWHILFSAQTAASTDSILTIYKNGVSQTTITLPASSNLKDLVLPTPIPYVVGDYFHSAITTVGTGLAGVSVQQLFRAVG